MVVNRLQLVLVTLQLFALGWGLKIMSFNVKDFGDQRYQQQNVTDVIVKLIADYDIALLLEILDAQNEVVPGLLKQVNKVSNGGTYNYSSSAGLGSSSHKEKYVFFYKTKTIKVLRYYQYSNNGIDYDEFERPPYAILVQPVGEADIPKFFLLGTHTKPSNAQEEINELYDVFLDGAAKVFDTTIGMILGDLNCDCEYVSTKAYSSLHLVEDSNFTWWINNSADTTTDPATDCAYDRIITYIGLSQHVVTGSGKVVRFDKMFHLSLGQTQSVSDHYPVEVTLQGTHQWRQD